MNHISLGVPDIHAIADQVTKAGIKLTEEPKDRPRRQMAAQHLRSPTTPASNSWNSSPSKNLAAPNLPASTLDQCSETFPKLSRPVSKSIGHSNEAPASPYH